MPGRTGKLTANKNILRQLSPEIPSPIKINEANLFNDNDDNIENRIPIDQIESRNDSLSITTPSQEEQQINNDLNPLVILLANGQPLLTNFEEKYLVDFICKSINCDIEIILREKISSILQMNYAFQSSSFTLNHSWIFDFLLKHFRTLIEHHHASECLTKFLAAKKFDQNNSNLSFKHWQLQTLINEHTKKLQSSIITGKKRRMTVRHIDLK